MTDQHLPSAKGQDPLTLFSVLWVIVLVIFWSLNSVIVKIVVRDIPPFFAAFFRFCPATLIIITFLRIKGISLAVSLKEFRLIFIVGFISALQIITFISGAQFTTGGRVTLFVFSYPFFAAILAPIIIHEENFYLRAIIGCTIAIAGLVFALYNRLTAGDLKGDIIELISALLLALRIVTNKKLMGKINIWKILVWSLIISTGLYGICGLFFEKINFTEIRGDAWITLVIQVLFTTCFTFLSWQYLLSKHSASKLTPFFFAAPIFGMVWGIFILGESFDPGLIIGSVLVGGGILIVQLHNPGKK